MSNFAKLETPWNIYSVFIIIYFKLLMGLWSWERKILNVLYMYINIYMAGTHSFEAYEMFHVHDALAVILGQ